MRKEKKNKVVLISGSRKYINGEEVKDVPEPRDSFGKIFKVVVGVIVAALLLGLGIYITIIYAIYNFWKALLDALSRLSGLI